jgi:hypothetical protein
MDDDDRPLIIPQDQLERALANAARLGAKAALKEIGLHDEGAAGDVKEIRGLLDAWRETKRYAWKTAVDVVTKGLLLLIAAGLAVKFWNR